MPLTARGLPTRFMLLASLVLVITSVTFSSLWVVRDRLQAQVLNEFSSDLLHSAIAFRTVDAERLAWLRHENALLADLPSLKALMTTADTKTVVDGGARFWTVAGSDLFALANSDAQVVALYTRDLSPSDHFHTALSQALGSSRKHFLLADGRLFEYAVQPLYFGTEQTGTLLGYVITGIAVDSTLVRQTTSSSPAEVTFVSRDVVTSTLPRALWPEMHEQLGSSIKEHRNEPATVLLGGHRYLSASTDLTAFGSEPLFLVVMKSFAHAENERHELNELLLVVGLCALGAGAAFMLAISGLITAPLEDLTRNVRAYGNHVSMPMLPAGGTREIRELNGAFLAMSEQLREKNRALLEAERLATIGRMASSVSHDLRHYLASVYANAEFLVSSRLSETERNELFEEIRMAVHGTTDLIDSLLVFGRSSAGAPRSTVLLSHVLERAVALVRAHPDAQGAEIRVLPYMPEETEIQADAPQVERAIFNLILNGCQASRSGTGGNHCVTVEIRIESPLIILQITDGGAGVADSIRESLFQPFVSQGKQNGTGLGLTLAQAIAQEHGGSVELLRSRPGETIFVLALAQTGRDQNHVPLGDSRESFR